MANSRQSWAEDENSSSSKKARIGESSSGKATVKRSPAKEKQCETEKVMKMQLTVVDKNKNRKGRKNADARSGNGCKVISDLSIKSDTEVNGEIKSDTEVNGEIKSDTDVNWEIAQASTEGLKCRTEAKTSNLDERDIFLKQLSDSGFKERIVQPKFRAFKPVRNASQNLMHVFQQFSYGVKCRVQIQKEVKSPVVNLTKDFELYRTANLFDNRVTALEWHPTKQSILAVGSKGGDILLWDTVNVYGDNLEVIGAAGSCQALKFWPWDTNKAVSASKNATLTLYDFETKQGTVLADTGFVYGLWYSSVDVNPSRNLVAAGRNCGHLHMMSNEGKKVIEYRVHKNKITHVEFSPREEWLLCTASTDETVQMWDIRYMKDRQSVLSVLHHNNPVNSAYFSRTDGCRLLTTDQGKEIRVYRAPFWHLETTVEHPHSFIKHTTPFKATWHPLQDFIICGRYPEKNVKDSTGLEQRTLDIFDADTGSTVSQLYSQGPAGLCPLNKFNNQGDVLASGMRLQILLWKQKTRHLLGSSLC